MKNRYNGAVALLLLIFLGCQKSDAIEDPSEQYRPQIHFTPAANWMNDPNGMVYYDDEYHLFYQYYPDSNVWGPMHWGHAVSKDMISWERLPIALFPDSLGHIFSGSAVIDWNNTTGFQNGEHPPMVAIFTQHLMEGEKAGRNDFQTQGIAYSLDKGRSWTVYDGNPVIPNPGIRDFRDPKVIWHEETNRWVMVFAAGDRLKFYTSPNLIDWQFASDFGMQEGAHGGVWECPDIFKLKVEGEDREKWVLLLSINPGGPNGGSGTQYFVGDFDGKKFTNNHYPERTAWLDYGRDNYAGVTWSDIPKKDGRRLFIGWMSNWDYAQVVPTETWRSAMTLPRSLHLKRNTETGIYTVESRLVDEINTIVTDSITHGGGDVEPGVFFALTRGSDLQGSKLEFEVPYMTEVTFDLKNSTGKMFGIQLTNELNENYYLVIKDGAFLSDRTAAGKTDFSEKFANKTHTGQIPNYASKEELKVKMVVDRSSVEIFIEDGQSVMTELIFPNKPFHEALIFAQDDEVWFKEFTTYKLKSIW